MHSLCAISNYSGPERDLDTECDKCCSSGRGEALGVFREGRKRKMERVGGWNSHYIDLKIKALCICSVEVAWLGHFIGECQSIVFVSYR